MKFYSLALIATISAQTIKIGDDCYFDDTKCAPADLTCITYEDGQYGESKVCEDCNSDNRKITDSYGDLVDFECPPKPEPEPEEEPEEDDTPAPAPAPAAPAPPADAPSEEEKASSLAMSVAAILAAVSIMG